jgi:hypothetical protein
VVLRCRPFSRRHQLRVRLEVRLCRPAWVPDNRKGRIIAKTSDRDPPQPSERISAYYGKDIGCRRRPTDLSSLGRSNG